jgi:hypothetical protein
MLLNWKHHVTSRSEQIKIFATIFPQVSWSQLTTLSPLSLSKTVWLADLGIFQDDCHLVFSKRPWFAPHLQWDSTP